MRKSSSVLSINAYRSSIAHSSSGHAVHFGENGHLIRFALLITRDTVDIVTRYFRAISFIVAPDWYSRRYSICCFVIIAAPFRRRLRGSIDGFHLPVTCPGCRPSRTHAHTRGDRLSYIRYPYTHPYRYYVRLSCRRTERARHGEMPLAQVIP